MFDEPEPSRSSSSFMGGLDSAMSKELGFGSGSASLPVPPVAAKPPPMFGAQGATAGKRPGKKPGGTFMGNAALVPSPSNLGSNTLLGQ